MTCPVCGHRKGRRACPALGKQICTVCCGTKRLVEIRCPDTCGYLSTARQHPPAVVQRQYDRDIDALQPTMRGLAEMQQHLAFLLLGVVSRQGGSETLERLHDADVSDAALALAGTFETAARGVIYEHRASTLPAQRLVAAFREALDDVSRRLPDVRLDRDAAAALRGIEQGVREVQRRAGAATGDATRAYIDVVRRMVPPYAPAPVAPGPAEPGSGLILPGV
jgi:hypothetical protein